MRDLRNVLLLAMTLGACNGAPPVDLAEPSRAVESVLAGTNCKLSGDVGEIHDISPDLSSEILGHYANGIGSDCARVCRDWATELSDGTKTFTPKVARATRFSPPLDDPPTVTSCEVTRTVPLSTSPGGCNLVQGVTPWYHRLPITAPNGALVDGAEGLFATGSGDKAACAYECRAFRDRIAKDNQISPTDLDVTFQELAYPVAEGDFICAIGQTSSKPSSELEYGGIVGVSFGNGFNTVESGVVTPVVSAYFGTHRWQTDYVWTTQQKTKVPASPEDDRWFATDPSPLAFVPTEERTFVNVHIQGDSQVVQALREPRGGSRRWRGQWTAGQKHRVPTEVMLNSLSIEIGVEGGKTVRFDDVLPPVFTDLAEINNEVKAEKNANGIWEVSWIPRANSNMVSFSLYAFDTYPDAPKSCYGILYNKPDPGSNRRTIQLPPACMAVMNALPKYAAGSVGVNQVYRTDVVYQGKRIVLQVGVDLDLGIALCNDEQCV